MTATVISPFLEYSEGSNKSTNMLNYNTTSIGGSQLPSVPCSSANLPSCTATGPLLDKKAVGAPSQGGLFQRRNSVSPPGAKFGHSQFANGFKTDASVFLESSSSSSSSGSCGNNKENRFRERSYSEMGDRLRPGSQVNSSRYKTELCRPFEENGTCKYGDKCQFAHGMHELRSLSRHPKYKTELCRTFHTIGICPYGPRCHFIHNAEERRGPPPLSAFNKMERPRLQHSVSFAGFPSAGGLQDGPASVAAGELAEWQSVSFNYSSQELAGLFGPSPGPMPAPEPQGPALPTPITPCLFQLPANNPFSRPDSLPDQESYQSSLGSQSDPESPLLDASRRLPIFSTLSVSDD